MKILLLHEMSGVHTELRDGLRKIGVDADIATYGDGWKKYPSDIYLGSTGPGIKSNISRALNQVNLVRRLSKYDVIQILSPKPFYRPLSYILESLAFAGNQKKIYMAAGSDAIYRNHIRQLNYYPPHDWFENKKEYSHLNRMLKKFDSIVPVCWEYKYCMQKEGFDVDKIMPFPINLEKNIPRGVGVNAKIKVFHPLNRDNLNFDFKGTLLIRAAFNELTDKYGDVAEFICAGGMSSTDYSTLTDGVDIIVDQAYSYSYGMSAAYGLAKGKVVLSGMEPIVRPGNYYKKCPIINILPSVEDIKIKIEKLIVNRYEIARISEASRDFAENFHCHLKVAEKFIKLYKGL